jgi:hypothetical protein
VIDAALAGLGLVGNQDHVERFDGHLEIVEDLAFHFGGQRRGVDEIETGLVFDTGARVDHLGVGERLHGRLCARTAPTKCRGRPALRKLQAEAILADRAQHRHAPAPSAARLLATVPPAPGVTSVRTTPMRGMPVSRDGSAAAGS